ncbi:MAG: glycosyltransferase [Candidatus Pacearchaeota archaeon]
MVLKVIPIYIHIYVYLVLGYLWYRFILRFISDIKSKKTYSEYNAKTSIIVPVYNEKDYLLRLCVESLINAEGDNEIILVDDCSTNNTVKIIKELKKKYPKIKAIHLKRNRGKRYAQYYGLKFANGEIVITIDSDTIIKKDAIKEILKPFNNPKIGAVTGNIRAFNREKNFLTKMIDARYKNAFTFERQGLAAFGIVTCCTGVLSAYRREYIEKLKEIYVSQKFLGKSCTYGDDRHLTNLFLEIGYKISYVKNAIAYTEVPTKYKEYIIQQLRWKKSFIRESIVIFPYSLKYNPLLALETFLTFIIPFLSLFARVMIIYLAFIYPLVLIPLILSICLMAFIRNMLLFFEEPKAAVYSIPFALFYELIIYWLYWIALFTLYDTRWGTRGEKKEEAIKV